MSQPYPGTTPSQPQYSQYPYQTQIQYAQYAQYAQGYAQQGYQNAGYYAYYPQQAYAATTAPKPPLPTLTLSNTAPASSSQQSLALPSAPTPAAQTATAPAPARGPRKTQGLKGTFTKELRTMMYAFGDSREPANDTVEVMEEILMEYLVDVCHTALAPTRKTRIQIEDLRRALGRHADSKKLARLEELLFMQDDMRRARKLFSTEEKDLEEQVHADS